MSNAPTKIRVIFPTHNRLAWLKESIESILHTRSVELWILANGCTDGTNEYLEGLHNPHIKVMTRDENKRGRYLEIVEMFPDTEGYLVMFSDDDHMLPMGLERKRKVLDNDPNLALVFSGVRIMNAAGEDQGVGTMGHISNSYVRDAMDFRRLLCGDYIPTPTVMMRTKAMSPYFYILSEKEHALADWQLWLHAANDNLTGAYLPEPTVRYRVHDQSDSTVYTTSGRYVDDHLAVWEHWAGRGYRPTPQEKISIQRFLVEISTNCGHDLFPPLQRLESFLGSPVWTV